MTGPDLFRRQKLPEVAPDDVDVAVAPEVEPARWSSKISP